jgi:CheY-like chemotaxis protein
MVQALGRRESLINRPEVSLPSPFYKSDMAKRILVADDNPIIRKMLCQLFEREEDYDICAEAKNGQEAIELALKHRPDLIILDWAMPLLGGLAAARELKKIMPAVPIILFTQHADTGITLLESDVNIDRVVSKSVPEKLMEHVKALAPA